MIELNNISKSYGQTVIFKETSFKFMDKGLVCVLGPSGCGKSTLLNLIAGFDSDYQGEITVHKTALDSMNEEQLSKYRKDNIGFIFQNYQLINGYTVLENILLSEEIQTDKIYESEQKAKVLLQKLGILDKINEKVENLSGGQKQRVAIARAIIKNPTIILADEPTGALDRKNTIEIMELLKEISKECLVIMITHDTNCANYASQIVNIKEGKLISDIETIYQNESSLLKIQDTVKPSLLKRAFKNFKIHLKRYLTIALAISIGTICFTLSLSSKNIMKKSIQEFESKNTAYHNGYIKINDNEQELWDILNQNQRLENVYRQYILKDSSITLENTNILIEEKYPTAKATEKLSYGIMPRIYQNEIAISPSLATKLDSNIQNLIGQKIIFNYNNQNYTLTISGIFNATYDDYIVSSDIEKTLYQGVSLKPYSISYDVIEFENIVLVNNELKDLGIFSENAANEVSMFLNTFKNLNRLFLIISILIFITGIFISIVLMVKQQNTRYKEVGLLFALGYTKAYIKKIFLYENLYLTMMSIALSIFLISIMVIVCHLASFTILFSLIQSIVAILLTALIVLIISSISTQRLQNVEVAKALRM